MGEGGIGGAEGRGELPHVPRGMLKRTQAPFSKQYRQKSVDKGF